MFENSTKFDRVTPFVPAVEAGIVSPASGTALRAFGWSELTARINAARDLRRVLHRDSSYGSASFGDAAAAHFKPASIGKQPVNHGDLEHGKSNWRKAFSAEENAATGDRET